MCWGLAACAPSVTPTPPASTPTATAFPPTATITATPDPTPTSILEELEAEWATALLTAKDTFVIAEGAGQPDSLDPAWMYDTFGAAIANNIYEGLVAYDRTSIDTFTPLLATAWDANLEGTEWTFTLRPGVTFHAGGSLEPHDVAYSMQRALLQGRRGGGQWMLYEAFFGSALAKGSVTEFAAAYASRATFAELTAEERTTVCEAIKAAVTADDTAGTIVYRLAQPVPWFLALLANPALGAVVDSEWMRAQGDWDGDCATWQEFADPKAPETILFDRANGTGPYRLDYWKPGKELALTANAAYWRAPDAPIWPGGPGGPPRLQRVVILSAPVWETRLALFEAGVVDYIAVEPEHYAALEPAYKTVCRSDGLCTPGQAKGYIQVWRDLPLATLTLGLFNWQINIESSNPFVGSGALDGGGIPADFFQDVHIRRAFSYCFDYETFIQTAFDGDAIQAQGPLIAGVVGYLDGEAPLFHFDAARCAEEFQSADLDRDGIPASEDANDVWAQGFSLQLPYPAGNTIRRATMETLKSGIEAINPRFRIIVTELPWPVLLDHYETRKLPIHIAGWAEDFHDPHDWAFPLLHAQGVYGSFIQMTPDYATKYERLLQEGIRLPGSPARRVVYEQVQAEAQQDAVALWLYQPLGRAHFQHWVTGFYYNPAHPVAGYSYLYALSEQ